MTVSRELQKATCKETSKVSAESRSADGACVHLEGGKLVFGVEAAQLSAYLATTARGGGDFHT